FVAVPTHGKGVGCSYLCAKPRVPPWYGRLNGTGHDAETRTRPLADVHRHPTPCCPEDEGRTMRLERYGCDRKDRCKRRPRSVTGERGKGCIFEPNNSARIIEL